MAIPEIELIYDRDCPNVPETRALIARVLNDLRLPTKWREWDRADPASPAYARQCGSPTVLVNGRDVAGGLSPDASCCRVYVEGTGRNRGVPPGEAITAALAAAGAP